jgi:hypothetical protein
MTTMRRIAVSVSIFAAVAIAPVIAAAQGEGEEDDDPGIARQRGGPASGSAGAGGGEGSQPPSIDEPFPDPVPPEEEDPGFVAPAGGGDEGDEGDDGHVRAPVVKKRPVAPARRPLVPPEKRGIRFRVAYRTFELGEAAPGATELTPGTKDDRFHAIAVDAYPISGNLRIGLVSQVAIEPSDDDWFGTVGLAAGLQNAGARWAPFGEISVRTGVGRRTFCGNVAVYDMCQDHLTMLWGIGLEGGVDGLLFGSTRGTLALGIEKNQFFSVEISGEEGTLAVFDDTTFTVKIGLGY